MKRFSRLFSMLVLVALLATPLLTTYAQGGNPLCEGLSADDCTLMTASDAVMLGVTSFSMPSFDVNFSLSMPDTSGEEGAAPVMQTVAFSAMGSGAVSMDPMAAVVLHLMVDEVTMTSDEGTQTMSLEAIVTPEMVYVMKDGEWYGGTVEEADIDVEELLGTVDSVDPNTLTTMGIDLTGVMATTRTDADGMAAFTTEINVSQLIVSLLSSPMVGGLLGEGMGGEAMSAEDVQMLGAFLTPMLAGTTLSMGRTVGLDDNYVYAANLDLVLSLDLSLFAPEIGAINGELRAAADMANFNEAVTATIPESYKPLDELDTGELESLGDGLSGLGM